MAAHFNMESQKKFNRSLGRIIRQWRQQGKFYKSVSALASTMEISPRQLKRYECGQSALPLWRFIQICALLKVESDSQNEQNLP